MVDTEKIMPIGRRLPRVGRIGMIFGEPIDFSRYYNLEGDRFVLAAALSNIALHGLDWGLLIPLLIGSVPGTILGARLAPKVPQSIIRRGIVVVLTMSGVALLDKAGWAPLGAGEDETHPLLIAGVGLAMLVLVPLVWGGVRRTQGLPMFGAPTVAELDKGVHFIGKKIVEEAAEVWMAAEHEGDERAAEEISQLLYHLQVLMLAADLTPDDVYRHL